MVERQQCDVLIIGGGAAGLSAGYFIAEHAAVVVLEREDHTAYHSSGRSAAMYIEGYENPVVAELTSACKRFFFDPPHEFTTTPLVTPRGGLSVASCGETAILTNYLDTWRSHCPDLTEISPTEASQLCGIINVDQIAGACYDPAWHSVDTHALLTGFEQGIRRRGGQVQTRAEVCELERLPNAWRLRTTSSIEYEANVIVNAGGAWANQIANLAGRANIPLTPMRRTAIIVPPPDDYGDIRHWPCVHTLRGDLYFKPESPGLMVCPQDEIPSVPMDAFAEELDVAVCVDRFTATTTHPVKRVLHQWAGLRTFAPDRRPVLGFDQHIDDFFWLAGQGGFGIQTSPELGRVAAEVIAQNRSLDAAIDVQRLG